MESLVVRDMLANNTSPCCACCSVSNVSGQILSLETHFSAANPLVSDVTHRRDHRRSASAGCQRSARGLLVDSQTDRERPRP